MHIAQTIAVALIGAAVLERLHVPAGALIGAMAGVAALNLLGGESATLPQSLNFLALATLGWAIGQGVTRETLSLLARFAVPLLFVVIALIVFGVLLAIVLVRFGQTDGVTAFLAASPGGLSQMAALANSTGGNAPLVAAVHTVRVITVIVLAPIVVRFVSGV